MSCNLRYNLCYNLRYNLETYVFYFNKVGVFCQ